MDDLERAASVGFADFAWIARDPDLDALRAMPRFNLLLERKETYLRGAAEASLASLKKQYGEKTYRYEIDTDLRLALAVSMHDMDDAAFQAIKSRLRVQQDALSGTLFEHKPEAYLTYLRPKRKDLRHLRGALGLEHITSGFYIDSERLLVAGDEHLTLAHEFTHALHDADRTGLHQGQHALWIREGLGELTMAASFEGSKFQPRDIPPEFKKPLATAKKRGMIPLQTLLTMPQALEGRAFLAFAESGSVMLYLWETGQLKKFYDTYTQTCAKDPTGKLALEETTGQPLAEFENAWAEWLAVR